ncbi:MAG TPA: thioesterase family protein, partial [Mycobacterium sp.]
IAVSGNFLWAPDPGAMRLVATVRKRGRRVSLVDVELQQGERTAVRASITLGDPEHHVPPLLSFNPVVPLMTPEPPPGLAPIGPGHPMADIVHLAHGCDIRPALHTLGPRSDGGPPVFEYWVRPKGVAPDVLFALLCGDVSAPVTFAVGRSGWAPTVQLTAYLRAMPADGWLRVMCTAVQIGQDWFDEDHIVVDSEGRIIVQSRQLAMVPPAQ